MPASTLVHSVRHWDRTFNLQFLLIIHSHTCNRELDRPEPATGSEIRVGYRHRLRHTDIQRPTQPQFLLTTHPHILNSATGSEFPLLAAGDSPHDRHLDSVCSEASAVNLDSFILSGPSNLPREDHDHNQSIRIAVPISVVGFLLAIGLVFWRRRRHTAEKNSGIHRRVKPQSLPTPFQLTAADLDLESRGNRADRLKTPQAAGNAISTRQAYISNQVNRVREKVAELEAETSTLLGQPSRSPRQENITPETVHTLLQTDDSNPPANDQRLERAVQQIEELNGRIRDLESQRRSSWALGLSDAPPPEYIE
ncbi:hypothetical protein C8R46DRAFT_1045063 [Mycena filopes]|nr:hypothetical protein C8R46DRAFT_1045063 [Mycena filopes]